MQALSLIVAIALPSVAAHSAVERALRGWGPRAQSRLLSVGLSVPLGLGGGSLVTYAWLAAGGSLSMTYVITDAILFAGAAVAARSWSRRAGPSPISTRRAMTAPERVTVVVAVAVVVVLVARFVQITLIEPHGGWDAWAIWNQRARFLLRAGGQWRAAFDPALSYSHPGYPLLLPLTVARLWAYSGETTVAPALAAAAFTFAPALVIAGTIARRVGWLVAAVAVLFTIGARSWVGSGASQYADVPTACFLVASVAAVLAARRADGSEAPGAYALAGAFLGLAAWTKDEGLLLAAVFGAWAALSPGLGAARTRVLALALGAAAPLVARALFQTTLAPAFAGVFTAGQSVGATLERVLDPLRWETILSVVPRHVPGAEVALPLLAVVAAVLLGARRRGLASSPVLPALLATSAYLLVYAATPLELGWHIGTSASRVLLQPWPAFVLGLFHLVGPSSAERSSEVGSDLA